MLTLVPYQPGGLPGPCIDRSQIETLSWEQLGA